MNMGHKSKEGNGEGNGQGNAGRPTDMGVLTGQVGRVSASQLYLCLLRRHALDQRYKGAVPKDKLLFLDQK